MKNPEPAASIPDMGPIHFAEPAFLLLLIGAVPVVWLAWRRRGPAETRTHRAATALRLLVLAILVLALARPQVAARGAGVAVVGLLDRSASVRRLAAVPGNEAETAGAWARGWLRRGLARAGPDDRLGLVAFDGRATVRAVPGREPELGAGARPEGEPGTDIAAALRAGRALLSAGQPGRLLLVSDGVDTRGGAPGLLATARDLAASGVPVDVVPLAHTRRRDLYVSGVHVPPTARRGETVAIRVVVRATQPARGRLHLRHDGDAVTPPAGEPFAADDFARTGRGAVAVFRFARELAEPGPQTFEARVAPVAGRDAVAANNRAHAATVVSGPPRVLLAAEPPEELARVEGVLQRAGFRVERGTASRLPPDASGLARYDAVVLANVPAERVPRPRRKALDRYVRDLGGGFVMIGGPDAFGAGGWTDTRIDELLPVKCALPEERAKPAGALVLVLDRSGSMSRTVGGTQRTQQAVANEAAVRAHETLLERDRVGVVAFNKTASWVVPLQRNETPERIADRIRRISPNGGTSIAPALSKATRALARSEGGARAIKHVVLLTDGQSKKGDYPGVLERMKRNGITLSTVGVGDNVDGRLLERLATYGGGAYHAVRDPRQLPRIFIKEARTIRKNLVLEKRFAPGRRGVETPVLADVGRLPALDGLVLTGARADPRAATPLVGPRTSPLLAHWPVGLGRTLAFTADATGRWAGSWIESPVFAAFWRRAIRHVARSRGGGGALWASREGDVLTWHLETDPQAMRDAPARLAGTLLRPDGSTASLSFEAVGPGEYAAGHRARESGGYVATAFREGGAAMGAITRPPSRELRRIGGDRTTLARIAEITGGRVLEPEQTDPARLFASAGLPARRAAAPLWPWLLPAAVLVWLLDVAVRRLDWAALLRASGIRGRGGRAEPRAARVAAPSSESTETAPPESREAPSAGETTSDKGRLMAAKQRARRRPR